MIWLKIIALYLPVVIEGVLAMQSALKTQPGATRKQVLLNVIQAECETAEKIPEQHIVMIAKLIDEVVASLRVVGTPGFEPPTKKTVVVAGTTAPPTPILR